MLAFFARPFPLPPPLLIFPLRCRQPLCYARTCRTKEGRERGEAASPPVIIHLQPFSSPSSLFPDKVSVVAGHKGGGGGEGGGGGAVVIVVAASADRSSSSRLDSAAVAAVSQKTHERKGKRRGRGIFSVTLPWRASQGSCDNLLHLPP